MTFTIDREEAAYCAGFFEGEGSIRHRVYNGGKKHSIILVISQVELFPLELFREYVGVGNIHGPQYRSGNQPIHRLEISNFEEVQHCVAVMWNWLSPKRKEQCKEALTGFLASATRSGRRPK